MNMTERSWIIGWRLQGCQLVLVTYSQTQLNLKPNSLKKANFSINS